MFRIRFGYAFLAYWGRYRYGAGPAVRRPARRACDALAALLCAAELSEMAELNLASRGLVDGSAPAGACLLRRDAEHTLNGGGWAAALVDALSRGSRATALDLSGNELTARGVAAVARVLADAVYRHGGARIKSLSVRGNPLRDEGVLALARGLPQCVAGLDVSATGLRHGEASRWW